MPYTVGIDYGTESGRAVLVDVSDGREVASAIHPYANGVIDEHLHGESRPLPPDWALQDPNDYLEVLKHTVPAVLKASGVSATDVIGVAIDFTACTMLPTKRDGTPLSFLPEWRSKPHAWVKLWKHHASQPQADQINETARRMGQGWLDRYGGKISSEWFFSKALQVLQEAPDVYAATERFIEATDWVIWQLTGVETRNVCTAGPGTRRWFRTMLIRPVRISRTQSIIRGSDRTTDEPRVRSARWARGRLAAFTIFAAPAWNTRINRYKLPNSKRYFIGGTYRANKP